MNSYIVYNNENSKNLDLIMQNIPDVPSANIEYEVIKVDGGEDLTQITGISDIEISFSFIYIAKQEEYLMKKARIDNWLLNSTSKELTYSSDQFKIYKVKQVKISETKTTSRIVRSFNVTFVCNGLKYMESGLKIQSITSSGKELYNFGDYQAKPLIKIYANGNVTVTSDNFNFSINNVNGYVVLDSEIIECYKDNINMGKYMTGDYPVFSIGKNIINWSGAITKIDITPRWRCF